MIGHINKSKKSNIFFIFLLIVSILSITLICFAKSSNAKSMLPEDEIVQSQILPKYEDNRIPNRFKLNLNSETIFLLMEQSFLKDNIILLKQDFLNVDSIDMNYCRDVKKESIL